MRFPRSTLAPDDEDEVVARLIDEFNATEIDNHNQRGFGETHD